MKRYCVAGLLFVLFAIGIAVAGEKEQEIAFENFLEELEVGYHGVKWEVTAQDFNKKRPGITPDCKTKSKELFLSYKSEILYCFRPNWNRMVVFLSEKDKDEIEKMMTHLYDEPMRTKSVFLVWKLENIAFVVIDRKGAPIMIDHSTD